MVLSLSPSATRCVIIRGMRFRPLSLGAPVIASVLLLDLTAYTPAAQEWQWAVATGLTRQRVVGLLDLPEMIANGCGRTPLAPVKLFDTPSHSGRSSAVLTAAAVSALDNDCPRLIVRRTTGQPDERLPTQESGY